MYILGIDLGVNSTGVALLNFAGKRKGVFCEECQQINKISCMAESASLHAGGTKEMKFHNFILNFLRDKRIFKALAKADIIVFEKPFNIPGYGHVLLEQLGLLKYFVIRYNKKYAEVPQTTLKKFATGSGKAQKSQMVMSAYKTYDFDPETEDEVDAFWAAILIAAKLDLIPVLERQKEVISKIKVVG